jgi:transcriptional enhancer factor
MMQNRGSHTPYHFGSTSTSHPPPDVFLTSKLPLIVDIAMDNDGRQFYHVHESSNFVRNQMPRLPPNSLVDGTAVENDPEDPGDCDKEVPEMASSPTTTATTSITPTTKEPVDKSVTTDIWPEEVEQAFEEVLRIVPKNGLAKIKVSGRSCGRNELISDYIYSKTGKFRTRKQVSSHIQVIKNLGHNEELIKLINDGPTYAFPEEQDKAMKEFEAIFSRINLKKSLGFNDLGLANKRSPPGIPASVNPKRQKRVSSSTFQYASVQGVSMSINHPEGLYPVYLSCQEDTTKLNQLKLNANADLSSRFPGLEDYETFKDVPIIHNLVHIAFPSNLECNFSSDSSFNSSYTIHLPSANSTTTPSYSMFTTIFSYGKKVTTLNEEDILLNTKNPFLLKFWRLFFNKFYDKDEKECSTAVKGITVKQILYENDVTRSLGKSTSIVAKLKIRLVLLWEFAKVVDFNDATTTTNKIILPQKLKEEPIEYPPPRIAPVSVKHEESPFDFNANPDVPVSYPYQHDSIQKNLAAVPSVPLTLTTMQPQIGMQKSMTLHQQPQELQQAGLQQFPYECSNASGLQPQTINLQGMGIQMHPQQPLSPGQPMIEGFATQSMDPANTGFVLSSPEAKSFHVEEPYDAAEFSDKTDFSKIYKANFHDML